MVRLGWQKLKGVAEFLRHPSRPAENISFPLRNQPAAMQIVKWYAEDEHLCVATTATDKITLFDPSRDVFVRACFELRNNLPFAQYFQSLVPRFTRSP
jgi:hypothetical protein